MLGAYAQVLRTPGAWQFSASGFVARMPLAITGLSLVLVVSATTGSYGLAGATASAFGVAAACCTIVTSRLVDRYGQHRILPILGLLHAGALSGFVIASTMRSTVGQLALAVLAGATQPAIGSSVRARWSYALRSAPAGALRSAFALESILDECIFTIGPILATTLALHLALPAPLILSAVLTATGTWLLGRQRRTEPQPGDRHAHPAGRPSAIRSPGLAVIAASAVGIGSVFGSYEVAAVAFATDRGEASSSGIILAIWALASGLSGLWFGSRHWHAPLAKQAASCTALLAISALPAMFVPSIPWLLVVTVASGSAIAPALISTFASAERLVPPASLTEGLTWANSGLSVGFSAGVGLAGVVIDHFGTSWAFGLPVLGAGLASALVAVRASALTGRMRTSIPLEPAFGEGIDEVPGPRPGAFPEWAPDR